MDRFLNRHAFVFNKNTNGGESLILQTSFFANGDPITPNDGVCINQKLTLQSYQNSASIELFGAVLTSKNLRQLADELDAVEATIRGISE